MIVMGIGEPGPASTQSCQSAVQLGSEAIQVVGAELVDGYQYDQRWTTGDFVDGVAGGGSSSAAPDGWQPLGRVADDKKRIRITCFIG
jgi:hypothetical protein